MTKPTIKSLKDQIADLQARIWRNSQYLALTQKQLALIYRASPASSRRSRAQLAQLRAAISCDSRQLADLNQALIAAIDGQKNPQIQEVLTRRYVNNQPFADIADAMGYDLRWVYRLHARGVGAEKKPG